MDNTIKVRENRRRRIEETEGRMDNTIKVRETEGRMDNTIKVRGNRRKNGQYNKS